MADAEDPPLTQHDLDYDALMKLLQAESTRNQLLRLGDSAEAQREAARLADDPVGCHNLLAALRMGSGDGFIRGVLARRNVDSTAEAERSALYASATARVGAVFETKVERPWYKR